MGALNLLFDGLLLSQPIGKEHILKNIPQRTRSLETKIIIL